MKVALLVDTSVMSVLNLFLAGSPLLSTPPGMLCNNNEDNAEIQQAISSGHGNNTEVAGPMLMVVDEAIGISMDPDADTYQQNNLGFRDLGGFHDIHRVCVTVAPLLLTAAATSLAPSSCRELSMIFSKRVLILSTGLDRLMMWQQFLV
jgi:hypothetical protein